MKKLFMLWLAALFILSLPNYSFPQSQEVSFSDGLRIKPGAHFEYFARKVTWDETSQILDLKSTIFALNLEIAINDGFSVSAIAGYSLSDYDSLIFRELPFSIDLDVGNIGGYIFGGEINKSLLYVSDFELGLFGQFLYHIGREENWDIPGLNVTGTVTGKPTWMRASVGPYIKFMGLDPFSPYVAACYNNLWGRFELNQTFQPLDRPEPLEGIEEKKLQSKGQVDITLGTNLMLSDRFFLKGEVHILPYGDGMDLGFVAIAAFSF